MEIYRLKYWIDQCSKESMCRFLRTALSKDIRLSFLLRCGKSRAAAVEEMGDFLTLGGGRFLGEKTFCFSESRFINGTFAPSFFIGESEGSPRYFFRTSFSSPI